MTPDCADARTALTYARQERDTLRTRVDAALDLHVEDDEHCTTCLYYEDYSYHRSPWPCPTVAALTGEDPR